MESSYFEDFYVGQRHPVAAWTVTAQDVARFGASAGNVVFSGISAGAALEETRWRYLAEVCAGDELRGEATVTSCLRASSGTEGIVNRHVLVRNQHDTRVQEGNVAVRVPARERGPDAVTHDFGSQAWGEALAKVAGENPDFVSATANWDGTVALRSGDREVHLRIYRGAVIDVARRAPLGATFTFGADELTWTELITGESNDFMRRAMAGEFDVRGNGYEYLRLTKVISLLIDSARSLAAGGARS